jgi:hypothetical protein
MNTKTVPGKYFSRTTFLLLLILTLQLPLLRAETLDTDTITLAENGKTEYKIVIPANTDVSTKAVAADFAGILKKITGAEFAVIDDTRPANAKEIIIGSGNKRLKKLGLAEMTKGFAHGEYEILSSGDKLIIAGVPERGSINGMYGFLQDHLGCRWFTPGASKIPSQKTITLNKIKDRQKPAFRWRAQNYQVNWDAAWAARNRLNDCRIHGGKKSLQYFMSDPRVKTFKKPLNAHQLSYLPNLFAEHPEFYAEIKGKRVCASNRNKRAYCLSNPEFVDYVSTWMMKRIPRNSRFIPLSFADNSNFCHCKNCRKQIKMLGSNGYHMQFINKVAKKIGGKYPDITVVTLAYDFMFKAPNSVKVEDNIKVIWCPVHACTSHSFLECPVNRDKGFIRGLAQWQKKVKHLGIWYYYCQYNFLLPNMKLFAAGKNFQQFKKMGIEEVFVQCHAAGMRKNASFDGDKLLPAFGDSAKEGYFTIPHALRHLKAYITARLLWDVNFDIRKGIADFCETYYGPAGKEMAEYALLVESEKSYAKTMEPNFKAYPGIHQSWMHTATLKESVIEHIDKLFDKAEAKVKNDKIFLRRVQMARLSPDAEILYFFGKDFPLYKKSFDRFFPLVEELGLKEIFRRMSPEKFKELLRQKKTVKKKVGKNLLKNSGFESETPGTGKPADWEFTGKYMPEGYDLDPAGISIDTSKHHSGKQSIRLSKKTAENRIVAMRQKFPVEVNSTYRAGVYYQAELKNGSPHLIFTVFNKEGKWLRHRKSVYGPRSTGGKWRKLESEIKIAPGTAELMVEFLFYDDQTEGLAWIDDFTCAKMID